MERPVFTIAFPWAGMVILCALERSYPAAWALPRLGRVACSLNLVWREGVGREEWFLKSVSLFPKRGGGGGGFTATTGFSDPKPDVYVSRNPKTVDFNCHLLNMMADREEKVLAEANEKTDAVLPEIKTDLHSLLIAYLSVFIDMLGGSELDYTDYTLPCFKLRGRLDGKKSCKICFVGLHMLPGSDGGGGGISSQNA
eukprot:1283789-Amorphochlora_amoeboformis.AAC.1